MGVCIWIRWFAVSALNKSIILRQPLTNLHFVPSRLGNSERGGARERRLDLCVRHELIIVMANFLMVTNRHLVVRTSARLCVCLYYWCLFHSTAVSMNQMTLLDYNYFCCFCCYLWRRYGRQWWSSQGPIGVRLLRCSCHTAVPCYLDKQGNTDQIKTAVNFDSHRSVALHPLSLTRAQVTQSSM